MFLGRLSQWFGSEVPYVRPAVPTPAYEGLKEFQESLYVPRLPEFNTNKDGAKELSIVFPLIDVSGSMHDKLANLKTSLCKHFLRAFCPNVVSIMAFTHQPYTIAEFSSMADEYMSELEKTVMSLFIPSHSRTDIPTALDAYLKSLQKFLGACQDRSAGPFGKANCIVITDGIQSITDKEWDCIQAEVKSVRSLAKAKRCFLFFHLLNLRSNNVDEKTLQQLAEVLEAERVVCAGKELDVCDTLSRHMVVVEKCTTEINNVKQYIEQHNSNADFRAVVLPRFQQVKQQIEEHQQRIEFFTTALRKFEQECHKLKGDRVELPHVYRNEVIKGTLRLMCDIEKMESSLTSERIGFSKRLALTRELASEKYFVKLSQDHDRISKRLNRIEKFVQRPINTQRLKEEFLHIYADFVQKVGEIKTYCKDNKHEQFKVRSLLMRVQRDQARADSVSKRITAKDEDDTILLLECGVCQICMDEADLVSLKCHTRFCAVCLARCICEETLKNRPATCPEEDCGHELFEAEIETACALAKRPDVADKYFERRLQSRAEEEKDLLFCPKQCGNLICSPVDNNTAVCDSCDHHFCPVCFKGAHPEIPDCMHNFKTNLNRDSNHAKQTILDDIKSLRYMQELHIERCPHCDFPCTKDEGCQHVTCGKCWKPFVFGVSHLRIAGVRPAGKLVEACTWEDQNAELTEELALREDLVS